MKSLKKSLSLLLALVMCLGMLTVPSFATAEANWTDSGNYNADWLGNYATTDSYTIANVADLAAFAVAVNSGNTFEGKTVTVTADNIDLSAHYWTPIGNTSSNPFSGTFNGNGTTISGLTINYSNEYVGLFGYIKGTAPAGFTPITDFDFKDNDFVGYNSATYAVKLPNVDIFGCKVMNLTVSGANVNVTGITGTKYAAAVVAYCENAAVQSVNVTNTTIEAKRSGGVVAFVPDNAVAFIDSCTTESDVTVTAEQYHAAGILARVDGILSRVIISNCTNNATISSAGVNGGGITGQAKYTLIYNCTNNGAVTGATRSAGIATNTSNSVIIKCTNTGTITSLNAGSGATNSTAGIDAYSESTADVIVNCTNTGSVTANCTNKAIVSGVVGGGANESSITIENCVNTGVLTNNATNGLVFDVSNLSSVEASFSANTLNDIGEKLASNNKNVRFTSVPTLTEGACTITPTAQEIITFDSSPTYLTLDLSSIATNNLRVNVSNATINVTGSANKNNLVLNIVGSGNNITYADIDLNLKYLYVTNNNNDSKSEVETSANVGRLVLAGTGKVEATVTDGTTIGGVGFATAGGTYTLNNYGTISHDDSGTGNQHTVSTIVACTITVNNHGTIEAIGNSYALLFYNGCTVVVNEYPDSSYTSTTNRRFAKTNGATVTFNTIQETPVVTDFATRVANAEAGSTITLDADVVLTDSIDINKALTIDLNGHSISYDASRVSDEMFTGTDGHDYLIGVKRGGNLTIVDASSNGGGMIDGSALCVAVKLTTKGENDATNAANVTVGAVNAANNFTIKGYEYGISGNGNRHNANLTVYGGTILATATDDAASVNSTGIYFPQDGTLTISGGTIQGYKSGAELRSGTLNVTGGTFKATATSYSSTANGNGATAVGAALAIAQHTTKKAISASITGGTYEGLKTISIANPQGNDFGNVTVSGSASLLTGSIEIPNGYEWVTANGVSTLKKSFVSTLSDKTWDEVAWIHSANLTLLDTIQLNAYLFVPQALSSKASYVTVTFDGTESDPIYLNTLTKDNGYYPIHQKVYAAQMDYRITITLYDTDGEKMDLYQAKWGNDTWQMWELESQVFTTSVNIYLDKLAAEMTAEVNNSLNSEALKAWAQAWYDFAVATKEYGAKAVIASSKGLKKPTT